MILRDKSVVNCTFINCRAAQGPGWALPAIFCFDNKRAADITKRQIILVDYLRNINYRYKEFV